MTHAYDIVGGTVALVAPHCSWLVSFKCVTVTKVPLVVVTDVAHLSCRSAAVRPQGVGRGV